jgi:hypothetical protein
VGLRRSPARDADAVVAVAVGGAADGDEQDQAASGAGAESGRRAVEAVFSSETLVGQASSRTINRCVAGSG